MRRGVVGEPVRDDLPSRIPTRKPDAVADARSVAQLDARTHDRVVTTRRGILHENVRGKAGERVLRCVRGALRCDEGPAVSPVPEFRENPAIASSKWPST